MAPKKAAEAKKAAEPSKDKPKKPEISPEMRELREREKRRVMSLYNPTMLRKAADVMDDGEVKDRILKIVGAASPEGTRILAKCYQQF